jgi:hypothetical protein
MCSVVLLSSKLINDSFIGYFWFSEVMGNHERCCNWRLWKGENKLYFHLVICTEVLFDRQTLNCTNYYFQSTIADRAHLIVQNSSCFTCGLHRYHSTRKRKSYLRWYDCCIRHNQLLLLLLLFFFEMTLVLNILLF